MAHDIWKDNIKLMLYGCHNCWSYKAIKFAFDAKLIDFNPAINIFSTQTFSEVCSISFSEDNIKDFINTIYEKRYISFVGICPKTALRSSFKLILQTSLKACMENILISGLKSIILFSLANLIAL